MKRLLQIFGIVLAVLWAPLASHCVWEDAPGLQFFKCATDTAENSDCQDDGCAQLENGTYKVSDTQTTVPLPSLTLWIQISIIDTLPAEHSSPVISAPPELPAGWQFSFRTALLPRAPSFVS